MRINSTKNIHVRTHRPDVWEFSSLTMKKEMVFSSVKKLETVVRNLEILKKEKFTNIVVPEFSYDVSDHILYLDMEYIKGEYIKSIHHYNVIYDELIEKESDYSITDYNPTNFIVKDDRIYLIDLDSYGFIPYEIRKKRWEDYFGIFAPIIRSYSGQHQMNVKLSCDNYDYLKLKKLLETVFNAKVERDNLPYYAYIDERIFQNMRDTMEYLRSLYDQMAVSMDLNPLKHRQKKDILRQL